MRGRSAGSRFSVVIVNYNGGEVVRAAVDSALGEGVSVEALVVVDNASADASDRALAASIPGITVVRNNCNAGFARAVNQGLRVIDREFALLLNNDAQLQSGALAAFANVFDTMPKTAIAGGQLRYPSGRQQAAFGPLPTLVEEAIPPSVLRRWNPNRYRRSTAGASPRIVESVFGACLAVRVAALGEIGLLDEDFFFYFEEIDWCRRARLHGWDVAYAPQARATHMLGHTAERTFAAARVEYQRSKLTYFRKASSRGTYILTAAVMLLRTAANAGAHAVAVVFTAFSNTRLRRKARAYWTVLAWQVLGRPKAWGLPGKCSRAGTAT